MDQQLGMVTQPLHLSHKQQRRLRKKTKRQCLRRQMAKIREANSHSEVFTEEDVSKLLAEEKLEKQRHDEEEEKWIERERIAQELFAQKKALEAEAERQKILEESIRFQKVPNNNVASQLNGEIQTKLFQRILDGIELTSENLPPNHRPEPPSDYQPPSSFEYSYKTKELCGFFWKTGACRYGDRCSRFHPLPPIDPADLQVLQSLNSYPPCLVLILENMFDNFSLRYDPLEVDESQLQSDYESFYTDVRPEVEVICGAISVLRCCRNAVDHLRGNVYIQFTADAALAMDAATRLNGRWYAGRRITTRLAYLGGGWKAAACGLHLRGKCPKGDRECNFLHLFLNPNESADDLLGALSCGLAELPPRRVAKRYPRTDNRCEDSGNYRRRSRRSTSSRSASRERRHRHRKSHRRRHHRRREKSSKRHSKSRAKSSSSSY